VSVAEPRRRVRRGWALALYAYAALFYVLLYAPLAIILVLSFNDSPVIGLPIRGWTGQWYSKVLSDPTLVDALVNSIGVGVLSAAVATVLALLLSLSFRRGVLGQRLIFQLILLPIILPGIVGGIVLLIFFGYLGIHSSLYGTVAVAHIDWVLPFAFLTLHPRVLLLDRSIEEAAMDLGARPLRVFTWVVLPILAPALAATALFSFSLSFDEFIRTLFVSGFDRTLPVAFWGLVVEQLAPQLPAMAVVIVSISIIVSTIGFVLARRPIGQPNP
jgi:ABC-type spermidine/putrescine transport system permease subunit II